MARRFVDLSVPLESGIVSDPPIMLPKIDGFEFLEYTGPDPSALEQVAKEDDEARVAGPVARVVNVFLTGADHVGP